MPPATPDDGALVDGPPESQPSEALTGTETAAVEERKTGSSKVLHEVIRLQGDEELDRPAMSLALSGLAAGTAISASVFGEAAIGMRLPRAQWSELLVAVGYAIGFIVVIMGRLQLFTENTLTAVLPLTSNPSWRNLGRVARLWAIVLAANLAGTLIVGAGIASGLVAAPRMQAEVLHLAQKLTAPDAITVFEKGIPAGFIIAALVWMLPNARGAEFFLIATVTWLIAIGDFSHVIASSTLVWAAWLMGAMPLSKVVGGFVLPALAGNILGGTGLFALLAHGQVKAEI